MFVKYDLSNKQKMRACSFKPILRQQFELVFVLAQENGFFGGFILKLTKRA